MNKQNYTVFIVKAYQTSQYVLPPGGIFLCKWRRYFAGKSEINIYVQSACVLNFVSGSVWVRNLVPTLREEHRLRLFESRVMRRLFGPKRDKLTGGCRKLHNEELHNL
jgi:hypothetical protein